MAISLRRRDQELATGQLCIQQSQRHRIDRGRGQTIRLPRPEGRQQCLLRTVVSQTLRYENAGCQTVARRSVALACGLV